MDKIIGLEFNNNNVRQLELLANGLEGVLLKKDTIETNFSLIMLNIESFIPNSNIFEYIFKTDISKRDKIKILIGRGKQYEKIKIIDNKIEQIVNEIEEKTATIRIEENELNNEYKIIEKIYEKIKIIDNKIERLVGEIQEKTSSIRNEENELNNEYTVINKMNSKLSNMDNQINEYEWRVYQGSGERALFDFLKKKLVVEKKLIK
jgi:ribosomal protein S17